MRTAVFLFLLARVCCVAQEYPASEANIAQLADELMGYQDHDVNYDELYENMVQFLTNPIDINKASDDELRFLSILTEDQVRNIIAYRKESGDFLSIYELQAVPGIDLQTVYKLALFVKIYNTNASWKNILNRIITEKNNYFLARYERTLQRKAGFDRGTADRFKGSADKLYLRFRTSRPQDFSTGFTLEKDPGEQLTWNPSAKQYIADYWSAHAQIQNKGRLNNLIVGDFQSQFGQGLVMGGAFGSGKGAETITSARRTTVGFIPYTSSNETTFMRGVATTWRVQKRITLSGFYSRLHRDAAISGDSTDAAITSLQSTGMHRNDAELEGRKKIMEQNFGSMLHYKAASADMGLVYHHVLLGKAVDKNGTVSNQFDFRGYGNENVSAFLNYRYKNFIFFSEAAATLSGGPAIVAGILGSLGSRMDISMLYRNYSTRFNPSNSNAFSESTSPKNETGFYWGWKYRINKKYNLAGYVDLFRFPWLRFRSYVPSQGHEWLLRVNYQPSKKASLFGQVREESKVRNRSDENQNLYITDEGIKRNFWLSADYGIGQHLRLKSRIQFSTYGISGKKSDGFTLLQDISTRLGRRLELTARYAIFDTEDFDNRQYVYENDVWLAYSLQAYNGTGIRSYVLLEYKINARFSVWIRYAFIRYEGLEKIGSGLDAISGNQRNDVKFQTRIKL